MVKQKAIAAEKLQRGLEAIGQRVLAPKHEAIKQPKQDKTLMKAFTQKSVSEDKNGATAIGLRVLDPKPEAIKKTKQDNALMKALTQKSVSDDKNGVTDAEKEKFAHDLIKNFMSGKKTHKRK